MSRDNLIGDDEVPGKRWMLLSVARLIRGKFIILDGAKIRRKQLKSPIVSKLSQFPGRTGLGRILTTRLFFLATKNFSSLIIMLSSSIA